MFYAGLFSFKLFKLLEYVFLWHVRQLDRWRALDLYIFSRRLGPVFSVECDISIGSCLQSGSLYQLWSWYPVWSRIYQTQSVIREKISCAESVDFYDCFKEMSGEEVSRATHLRIGLPLWNPIPDGYFFSENLADLDYTLTQRYH